MYALRFYYVVHVSQFNCEFNDFESLKCNNKDFS